MALFEYAGSASTRLSGVLALGWVSWAITLTAPARAEQFEDAQAGMSKAYGDYYKALKKSPNPSQDAAALSKQILAPAQAQLSKAMSETADRTVEMIHKAYRQQSPPPDQETTVKPVHTEAPSNPKTVLDGAGIPREIEFGGPKKATPAPTEQAP